MKLWGRSGKQRTTQCPTSANDSDKIKKDNLKEHQAGVPRQPPESGE